MAAAADAIQFFLNGEEVSAAARFIAATCFCVPLLFSVILAYAATFNAALQANLDGVDPFMSLLDFVRTKEGYTGTKSSCRQVQSGALCALALYDSVFVCLRLAVVPALS